MKLDDLIKPDRVLCNVSARSKKHCLEILSQLLTRANPDIASEDVFAKLVERERLGCTVLDEGLAFPHCRISGLDTSTAALLKLAEPVDFDSPDGQPVDVVLGLMMPGDLDAEDRADMEMIANLLRNEPLGVRLRAACSSKELSEALLDGESESTKTPLKSAQQA